MKIIDNFIDAEIFQKIRDIILESRFPWFFVNGKSELHDGDFQFTHTFVDDGGKIVSPHYRIILPILKKINPKSTYRVKANLTPKKNFNKESLMHTDTKLENIKTAVFYCNDNNGSTLFHDGKKVLSKSNRIVIFDGDQKHCGVDCTDENIRVVINFNFFEN